MRTHISRNHTVSLLMLAFIAFFSICQNAIAYGPDPKYKVVIQVSTDDPRTQSIALNNAVNLQKEYGVDNIDVEIVAYGPGLGMLTKKSKLGPRIKSLTVQDIRFSACGNTMSKITKKTGKTPKLTEGVSVVRASVGRIIELQSQGYSYIRP